MVPNFANRAHADSWLVSPERARLVAEADLHADGELEATYVSGLEGWLARPRQPVLAPTARWRLALVTAMALLPLLEVISYLVFRHLAALPVWARPLISVALVIPLTNAVCDGPGPGACGAGGFSTLRLRLPDKPLGTTREPVSNAT